MIVRDEAAIIERCLASVRPFIDHWVIVDTGSVDETPQRVQAALAGIPGALHHRPWRNFGHNRTEALNLARAHGDYRVSLVSTALHWRWEGVGHEYLEAGRPVTQPWVPGCWLQVRPDGARLPRSAAAITHERLGLVRCISKTGAVSLGG